MQRLLLNRNMERKFDFLSASKSLLLMILKSNVCGLYFLQHKWERIQAFGRNVVG